MNRKLQRAIKYLDYGSRLDTERVTEFSANKFRQTIVLYEIVRTLGRASIRECQRQLFGTETQTENYVHRRQTRRLLRRLAATGLIKFDPSYPGDRLGGG